MPKKRITHELQEGDAHVLNGCAALMQATAAALARDEYWDGLDEGLQLLATVVREKAGILMEMGY